MLLSEYFLCSLYFRQLRKTSSFWDLDSLIHQSILANPTLRLSPATEQLSPTPTLPAASSSKPTAALSIRDVPAADKNTTVVASSQAATNGICKPRDQR